MKALCHYFKGYLREAYLGPFFKLLEAVFELLVPIILASIVDSIIPNKNYQQLYQSIALLVVLAVIGVGVSLTAQYFSAKAAVGFTRQLSKDLFRHIMGLSQADRDELSASSLMTRLSSDTYQIQVGINQFLRLFLRAPIIVFGSLVMAYWISPDLTHYFCGMVLLLFLVIMLLSRLLSPLYRQVRRVTDQMVSVVRQQLQGVRVIRAFRQEKAEESEFRTLNTQYTGFQLVAGRFSSLLSPLTYLIVNSTLLLVIWQGSHLIWGGRLTQGMLVALVNYLLQILTELIKMTLLITTLNQSHTSAKRIKSVFEKTEEDLELSYDRKQQTDKLVLADVSFSYPLSAVPVLSRLSFSLKKGENLGVIGGTGSGKSTLVALLNHLYAPTTGNLEMSYLDQTPSTLREWRSWVSVVPQQAELFQGTVRSNLTLGLSDSVSDDRLWQALTMAQASDFIAEKPEQLDAEVEAFGRNFSGGQRQRLTIARAILRQAPFLVLDDATSALDYLTESRVLQALREGLKDTTLILISQRTHSLKQVEKILVLEKGEQVGFGTHEYLVQTNPYYQAIYQSQDMTEVSK